MSVEKKFYGYTADQKEISSYTLTNKSGMKAVLRVFLYQIKMEIW